MNIINNSQNLAFGKIPFLSKRESSDAQTAGKESSKTTEKELDDSLEYLSVLGKTAVLKREEALKDKDIETAVVDMFPGLTLYIDAKEASSYASALNMRRVLDEQEKQRELEIKQKETEAKQKELEAKNSMTFVPYGMRDCDELCDCLIHHGDDDDFEEIYMDDDCTASSDYNHYEDSECPQCKPYDTITITEEDW